MISTVNSLRESLHWEAKSGYNVFVARISNFCHDDLIFRNHTHLLSVYSRFKDRRIHQISSIKKDVVKHFANNAR